MEMCVLEGKEWCSETSGDSQVDASRWRMTVCLGGGFACRALASRKALRLCTSSDERLGTVGCMFVHGCGLSSLVSAPCPVWLLVPQSYCSIHRTHLCPLK